MTNFLLTTKFTFIFCLAITIKSIASNVDTLINRNHISISAGYGMKGAENISFTVYAGSITNSTLPRELKPVSGPINLKIEYFLTSTSTIGCDLFYSIYTDPPTEYFFSAPQILQIHGHSISSFLRMNKHFYSTKSKDKTDTYVGGGIGCSLQNLSQNEDPNVNLNLTKTKAVAEISVGVKALISKGFGIYTELGFSTSSIILVNFGLSTQF